LAGLLRDIGLAAKRVNVEVNKAGLIDIFGRYRKYQRAGRRSKKTG
jgi:fructose-1,6-bisphosphatase I